jgi:phage terminase large subunit
MRFKMDPQFRLGAMNYYKTHPVTWINHWGMTADPRNAGADQKVVKLPFILFPKQRELIMFLHDCLMSQENGLIEKSRDMGATWACGAFSVWMWLFLDGSSVGWGSRKEQLVDRMGDMDSIFEKIRTLIGNLPREMLPPNFSERTHFSHMKIINPDNEATITGEAGDSIGRGGRKSMYFKDESAHYERPEKIEASLGDNTNVQIDISSVNGTGNVFHRRREAGEEWSPGKKIEKGVTRIFVMDWRDHPGKSQDWYDNRRKRAINDGLLHIFSQEVDRDYSAAIDGIIIPAHWVKAAIDAHLDLGFNDSGLHCAGLDVADEGGDKNALAVRKGVILKSCVDWGERDVGVTTRKTVGICSDFGTIDVQYDCIGIGAGVKAEANRLVDELLMPKSIHFHPWSAAASPLNPEGRVIDRDKDSPLNKDFYENLKAQAWWQLRRRFEKTYRALQKLDGDPDQQDFTYDSDELISIPSNLPNLRSIEKELSQPVMTRSSKLKLMVDKTPEGSRSPNLADAIVMAYWPVSRKKLIVPKNLLNRTRMNGRRR